ncbi:ORF153 [Staphylococcus phage 29]|uniref:ORF153 n=2 Tax=Phietavirus TaxID=1623298 RepID=Q4ZB41_9CAUD|nr:ORF153 [Staphylococcus phage 29]YP_240610.1 ORF142 [Staphylococcus phage 52A]AAX91792.1 ORF153 [Staphylococcus phage 29]AAX91856.1 ORF142 [Staphylococcus phage 52A]
MKRLERLKSLNLIYLHRLSLQVTHRKTETHQARMKRGQNF